MGILYKWLGSSLSHRHGRLAYLLARVLAVIIALIAVNTQTIKAAMSNPAK